MKLYPVILILLAIGGALRLARGDRRGLGFFDASIDGFWRSFRAALICYPPYLLHLRFRIDAPVWEAAGVVPILATETIAYVISWVAFPLLILPLARQLGRENRFLGFMVAYNWSQIPQAVLFVLIGLDDATGLLPPPAVQVAGLLAVIAVLVYQWFIARVALAVNAAQAMVVVIIDVVMGTALGHIAEQLYAP